MGLVCPTGYWPPQTKMKQFFQRRKLIIIQTSIIILISFFLGEVSLRVYNYFNPAFVFYSNSYNRFRGKPYADDYSDFKLNSRGFKDKEFTEKKENVYRIIGIGDSFTFGVVPYKYNYLTKLNSQLRQNNYNIEVLNMGIPSLGPIEYLSLFVREGLELKPNMLLLTFYIGNDFTDCAKRINIIEYSYIASIVNYLIALGTKYEGNANINLREYYDDKPTIKKEEYLKVMGKRSSMYIKGDKAFIELVDSALYYLSSINDICKKQHIEFIVVIAPDEFQINEVLQKEVVEAFYPKFNKEKWDITLPNKMLTDRLEKLGIKYIDLYPYFREKSGERLYKPNDTHWNIAGNQLSANIIQEHILSDVIKFTEKSR
jgi:hypothetical protein